MRRHYNEGGGSYGSGKDSEFYFEPDLFLFAHFLYSKENCPKLQSPFLYHSVFMLFKWKQKINKDPATDESSLYHELLVDFSSDVKCTAKFHYFICHTRCLGCLGYCTLT